MGRGKTGALIEAGQPLSQSVLWRLQRRFFERQGIRAWSEGTVPSYLTSNPRIADAYAQVVLGWLRDCAPALDRGQPVHILELGCGSGRFGYLFLNRLLDLLGRSVLRDVAVRYVLTDFTESTLDPLRSHPTLQRRVEEGHLDFAVYDAGRDFEVRLSHCGETLTPETLGNPLAVIANYVFDSIPQDCFELRDGQVFERLVTVRAEDPHPGSEPDLDDPDLLGRVSISYDLRAAGESHYGDPDLDRILRDYAGRLSGTTLLFPCTALRCARSLGRLARGRLLLLSGDKGFSREEALHGRGDPFLNLHGSFSMVVNYHAIGELFRHAGGEVLDTGHLSSSLNISACLLGLPESATEARMAFDEAVERLGPDDFFQLKTAVEAAPGQLTLAQILAWLRLSGWDASVVRACFSRLMELLGAAPISILLAVELRAALRQVWETCFPLREEWNLPFHLGVLLCELEGFSDALELFRSSIELYGPEPASVFNLGLCLYRSGEPEAALECLDRVLEAEPGFLPASALRAEIEELRTAE